MESGTTVRGEPISEVKQMPEDDIIRSIQVKDGLKNRYSETFMITPAKSPLFERQVYLWLVAPRPNQARSQMDTANEVWSLVRTFVPKDIGTDAVRISVQDVFILIETALSGRNPELLESLDRAVLKSKARAGSRI